MGFGFADMINGSKISKNSVNPQARDATSENSVADRLSTKRVAMHHSLGFKAQEGGRRV